MTIYCQICGFKAKSLLSLSKHIYYNHTEYSLEKYYKTFVKKDKNEGKCKICGKKTIFENINIGYRDCCSRSCSAKLMRSNLKKDIKKFDVFRKKAKNNTKSVWKTRSHEETEKIKNKISKKVKESNSLLTNQGRKEKFSRYYRCDKPTLKSLNEKGRKQCLKNHQNGKSGYKSAMKGYFKCSNPQKYNGDSTNIIYRSSYEFRFFMQMDNNPNIKKWSSEEVSIPYVSPKDNRYHRYFPDVIYTTMENKTYMVEIKPAFQTVPPVIQEGKKRKSKSYLNEVMTWGINSAKWKAAREYCKSRGYEFIIVTEHELGVTF